MNKQPQKFWEENEIALLIKVMTEQSLSYRQVYKKYFPYRSHYSVQGKCKKLGLISKGTARKYFYDDDYFSKHTIENSYYAGYFMADACIYNHKTSKIFSWSVADKDLDAMKEFIEKVKFEGKISSYDKTCSISKRHKDKIFRHHKIAIVNCRWINDLENNFGVTVGKTYRNVPQNFPNLECKLAFMCGLIDGDGCITRMKKDNSSFCISLCSCSLSTIEWFKKTIIELNLPSLAWKDNKIITRENLHYFTVRGVEAAFLFKVLKNINVKKLVRKWENPDILKCVEASVDRYWNSPKKDPKKSIIY